MKTNQRFLVSRNKREGKYLGKYGRVRSRYIRLKAHVWALKFLHSGAW